MQTPPSKLVAFLRSPTPWVLIAVFGGAFIVHRWVESIGGPEALIERFGIGAPLVLTMLIGGVSATPFPTEPFAVATAAAYGWAIGAAITWIGWTFGSLILYGLARRGASDMSASIQERIERLPAWVRRLPIEHPVFLVVVRWVPAGAHLANLIGGARRISVGRQLVLAGIGAFPSALMWTGIGAGVGSL